MVVTVIALAAAACGDGGEEAAADDEPSETEDETETETGPPFDVSATVTTLTDESRPTPETGGAPARATRDLETYLYEPDGGGPFPLIVFAHGLNGHPRKFTELHEEWAAAGYVVAAPTFPVSNDEAPGGGDFIDLGEQPADMSFVLDHLLGPDSPLTVAVDPGAIGAGGLSLGGATVYGMVYDDCCRDERVRAAMVLDGNPLAFSPDLTSGPPLLIAHADPDPSLPYDSAVDLYDATTIPSALLTIVGPAHAEPFEDVAHPADEVASTVTVGWWDLWLGEGDQPAVTERIDQAIIAEPGVAGWDARLG